MINPSIWPTTTEFTFLETIGLGKPFFCYKVGIHKEVIRNGINGFAQDLKDYKSLAESIEMVNKNDLLYKEISQNSFKLYKKLTNKKNWKKQLQEII